MDYDLTSSNYLTPYLSDGCCDSGKRERLKYMTAHGIKQTPIQHASRFLIHSTWLSSGESEFPGDRR